MKFLIFALFAAVCAQATEGALTGYTKGLASVRSQMHLGDIILSNPHLKPFEQQYFIAQSNQETTPLNELNSAIRELRKNLRSDFPFAGYSSLDRNLYNRFVKEDVENEKYRKIGELLDELKHGKEKAFPEIPVMDPSVVSDVKLSIEQIDKAKRQNDLRLPHSPLFVRPFEDGKEDLTTLNTRVNELAANIRRPLTAPEPSQEEVAALRRLDEKMEMISKRIHSLPSPAMEEHVLVQSQMLSGLSDLLRRMTGAVEEENKEAFLYQIHALLHRHHLHDHPFIQEFEHELARAIATGNRFDTQDLRLPAPYNAPRGPASNAVGNSQYEAARYHALKSRNVDEANIARDVASEMKGYGHELVDKAKEMNSRAQIMERQQSVPAGNAYNVAARIRASTY